MMNGIKDGSNMLTESGNARSKRFDYKAITAVRRQYTPHIYTLYILHKGSIGSTPVETFTYRERTHVGYSR